MIHVLFFTCIEVSPSHLLAVSFPSLSSFGCCFEWQLERQQIRGERCSLWWWCNWSISPSLELRVCLLNYYRTRISEFWNAHSFHKIFLYLFSEPVRIANSQSQGKCAGPSLYQKVDSNGFWPLVHDALSKGVGTCRVAVELKALAILAVERQQLQLGPGWALPSIPIARACK